MLAALDGDNHHAKVRSFGDILHRRAPYYAPGRVQELRGFVFNAAIENDIFEVCSASLAARPQMSVERLEADLLAWYRRDRVANSDRPQYPLQIFTVGTLEREAAPGSLSK